MYTFNTSRPNVTYVQGHKVSRMRKDVAEGKAGFFFEVGTSPQNIVNLRFPFLVLLSVEAHTKLKSIDKHVLLTTQLIIILTIVDESV